MGKCRLFLLFLFFGVVLGISYGYSVVLGTNDLGANQSIHRNTPNHDTPLELQAAWLQFHQQNLCQKVDAIFIFTKGKMEVWVNSKNDKNYGELLTLLKPLQNTYRIDLHKTLPATHKESADIRTPPPSFWWNSKLTGYLHDSFLRNTGVFHQSLQFHPAVETSASTMDEQRFPRFAPDPFSSSPTQPRIMYEQRLLMFARDTLKYSSKIKRYAADLPLIAHVAFDPTVTPELRRQALAVCREHAKKLQKYENKLNKNLLIALPAISGKQPAANPLKKSQIRKASPFDISLLLVKEAQGLSNTVYRFMYPQNYTVTLTDLRNPPIIQSLATIQQITAEFSHRIQ